MLEVIVTLNKPWQEYGPDRFAKSLAATQHHQRVMLPHPEIPASPFGTSKYRVLYALGHQGQVLEPIHTLSPTHLRALRQAAYDARTDDASLHVLGMIDRDSPYGSRRLVEETARALHDLNVPTVAHLAVWNPTPSEFQRGLRELQFPNDSALRLGSLVPIHSHYSLDHFVQPTLPQAHRDAELPLHQPFALDDYSVEPGDTVVILNHSLHGLDQLADSLHHYGVHVRTLPTEHPTHESITHTLDAFGHVLCLTDNPRSMQAYFGDEVHHQYFESYTAPSAIDGLEMLISPHFGYHQAPARTVVLLDEATDPNFDWLLSSYLKQNRTAPYYCCLVDETSPAGNVVLTNVPNDDAAHRYIFQSARSHA